MAIIQNERIAVVAGATSVGVTLVLGDVLVSVRTPSPSPPTSLNEAQVRTAALKSARRALEVALQELQGAGG